VRLPNSLHRIRRTRNHIPKQWNWNATGFRGEPANWHAMGEIVWINAPLTTYHDWGAETLTGDPRYGDTAGKDFNYRNCSIGAIRETQF
jgi:hypothetical protein